jgi:hypothetical protein
MPEPMTLELVLDVLRMLAAAFPGRMDDRALMRRADVYRDNLQGMSGDALRWAAKIAIQEDSYFPKVARLRALATRWTVANTATVEAQNQRPSGWCEGCQSVARPEKRWRPKVNDRGEPVRDSSNRLLLEQFERVVCRCDAPSRYSVDDLMTPEAP